MRLKMVKGVKMFWCSRMIEVVIEVFKGFYGCFRILCNGVERCL